MSMKNAHVAEIFYKVADPLEIEDGSWFKIEAYRDAARTVIGHPRKSRIVQRSGGPSSCPYAPECVG